MLRCGGSQCEVCGSAHRGGVDRTHRRGAGSRAVVRLDDAVSGDWIDTARADVQAPGSHRSATVLRKPPRRDPSRGA